MVEQESSLESALSLHDSWTTQETLSSGLGVRLVDSLEPPPQWAARREREGGREEESWGRNTQRTTLS